MVKDLASVESPDPLNPARFDLAGLTAPLTKVIVSQRCAKQVVLSVRAPTKGNLFAVVLFCLKTCPLRGLTNRDCFAEVF